MSRCQGRPFISTLFSIFFAGALVCAHAYAQGRFRVSGREDGAGHLYDAGPYVHLEDVVNQIGSAQASILIAKPDAEFSGPSLHIPKNITLWFVQGGQIVFKDSQKLFVQGSIEAGPYQIFKTSKDSAVLFLGPTLHIYPQWWGAKAEVNHDNTEAINAAIDSLPTSGGGLVIPPGTYETRDVVISGNPSVPTNPIAIHAYGATLKTTTGESGLQISGNGRSVFGLTIDHRENTSAKYGFNIAGGSNTRLVDVTVLADGSLLPWNSWWHSGTRVKGNAEGYAAFRIGNRVNRKTSNVTESHWNQIETSWVKCYGSFVLFNLPFTQFDQLDKRVLPEELTDKFVSEGFGLSDTVEIRTEKKDQSGKGVEWLIGNGPWHFHARKTKDGTVLEVNVRKRIDYGVLIEGISNANSVTGVNLALVDVGVQLRPQEGVSNSYVPNAILVRGTAFEDYSTGISVQGNKGESVLVGLRVLENRFERGARVLSVRDVHDGTVRHPNPLHFSDNVVFGDANHHPHPKNRGLLATTTREVFVARGFVSFSGSEKHKTVTLNQLHPALQGSDYVVFFDVVSVLGSPPMNATRVLNVTNKTPQNFEIELELAPRSGTVTLEWRILR